MNRRVCLLTSAHTPFDFRIFSKECKSLVGAGYEVTVVAPHCHDEFVDGVRIKAVPKPTGKLRRMTVTAWQVFREAMRQNADVYLFPDPEMIPPALLLRSWGKNVIYDIRESTPLQFVAKDYLPGWFRSAGGNLVGRLQEFAVRRFSSVVAATPFIATKFEKINSSTFVIHNFPGLDELSPADVLPWNQRSNWIAYVGVITAHRGLREMLTALSLLPENLKVTLKIGGEFSPYSLREEASHAPGWDRTDYLGFMDRHAMWDLLRQARVGLVTLHPVPNHLESWPVKMFEYMLAGIPVIASDFPLWRKIVESAGCGLIVNPLDPSAIAEAIEYLLAHPREAETMGRRGREAVETRYNWGLEEPKLLQLFKQLSKS